MNDMNDSDFADELIKRLNRLCEDPSARAAVVALLDAKVDVGSTLDDHPTCQVSLGGRMGCLGMMNGLTGVIGSGPRARWGLICAGYSDENGELDLANFMGFFRTDECPAAKAHPTRTPGGE